MRRTQSPIRCYKETPIDAEIASHRLLLRAGFIRQTTSGIYSWLPLGLRVLHKVAAIVREEMNKAGAIEIAMPMVQPAELWQASNRWQHYGRELLRFTDRHDRAYCLGPTHEEVICELAQHTITSYRQLPFNWYQIQTKFRDEVRPRFGLLRTREFLMKDAYSFHANPESLHETYEAMRKAYTAIFARLGLTTRMVAADTGQIGGDVSAEFHAIADVGEDALVFCEASDYCANMELAIAQPPQAEPSDTTPPTETLHTPNAKTIEAVAEFLELPTSQCVKLLVVKGTTAPAVGLVLRGNDMLNEVLAEKHPEIAAPLTFVEPQDVAKHTGCAIGSLGPKEAKIPILVDHFAATLTDFCAGANREDYHHVHLAWGRDVPLDPAQITPLRCVQEGDASPDGAGTLRIQRGIELGHIFELGQKYARAMDITFLDSAGKTFHPYMGCYGIGVSRIVAALIEQYHDEAGMAWPPSCAPFDVQLVSIGADKNAEVANAADSVYEDLQAAGFEVLYDDRAERPGVKFSDADLIGIPHRLTVSAKHVSNATIEYKARTSHDNETLPMAKYLAILKTILKPGARPSA